MYKSSRNDAYIQKYNPIISAIWRANCDFSPIISTIAVLLYIAKYVSKGEPISKLFINTVKEFCSKTDASAPVQKVISKILISKISDRDYSAQEVAHMLMSWPLYKSTWDFIVLNIYEDDWEKLEVRIFFTFLNFLKDSY